MRPKPKEDVSNPSVVYPVSGWELKFYFFVWIAHSLIAVVFTYLASNNTSGLWFNSGLRPSRYLDDYVVDDSDSEWLLFRESVITIVSTYVIHNVIFRIAQLIPSRTQESLLLVIVWTGLFIQTHSFTCFWICLALTLTVTTITVYTRKEWIAWMFCVIFVLNSGPQMIPYSMNPAVYYREYQMYVYTAVKILNFNIYMCRNKHLETNPYLVISFMEYLLYPPYCSTLIVLFEDYIKQRRNLKPVNWRQILFLAVRLLFWFFVTELSLHFMRFNAFFNAPFTMMTGLHNYQIVSIAYIAGQYFHTKYVVIFGIPRLFALADGMSPPASAICISRVTKYSRMWRYFDRGLYEFLKKQLYIPFLGKSSSVELAVRRFAAMVIVFAFVLCWHGINGNYTYWVLLSALELVIERVGFMIYTSKRGTELRKKIGEVNFARLTAIACITNVVPGIFGAFFFLDKKDNGNNIFHNVLLKGIYQIVTLDIHFYNSGFVFSHLICLGYCFSHVCAYLNAKLDTKTKVE